MNLHRLFEPGAIAIIGASRDAQKVGGSILSNLRAGGFSGRIYPINPKARRIQTLTAYPSVRHVRGSIDLAVIAVPASLVEGALHDVGQKRIPFAIIITSGFAEVGSVGVEQERRLRSLARQYHIHIVGPNCLGVISTRAKMNASFAGHMPLAGSVSCVSQSGALLVSLMDWCEQSQVGIRNLVSIGNQAGVTELDMLEYLAKDPGTSVVGMYIEQISDGPGFMQALRRCVKRKPVVILKAGFSASGARAAASHTGSIAGSWRIAEALIRQSGAVLVRDIEDYFRLLEWYARGYRGSGGTLGILTNAGGPGVITVDTAHMLGMPLGSVPEAARLALSRALPSGVALTNPVDLLGDADDQRFKKALLILARTKIFSTVLVIITPQRVTPIDAIAKLLVHMHKRSSLEIVVCTIGGQRLRKAREILRQGGIMQFAFPGSALRTLTLARGSVLEASLGERSSADSVDESTGMLMPYRSLQRMLIKDGFPLTKGMIVRSPRDLRSVRRFPIVIKALSARAVHKARAGAVVLDINSQAEASRAVAALARKFGGRGYEGILIQPKLPHGKEFIMGIKRDPMAGLVLLFGIGGSLAEELHDVVIQIGPLRSRPEAMRMLEGIRHRSVLEGIDRSFIVRLLLKLSAFALRHPEIKELDFNPVTVYPRGGTIIDARIITDKANV